MLKDSVFLQSRLYFPDDSPLSSEKAIADELDKIEKPTAKLLSQKFDFAVESTIDVLSKAIADKNEKKIKDYKWILSVGVTNSLWGEWLLGWDVGYKRGNKEINQHGSLGSPQAVRRLVGDSTIAKFSQEDETAPWEGAARYVRPEAESTILRNRAAEKAIKARTNTLARDVSNSEWQDIKGIILKAIKPQSSSENPISRKELLKQINEKLGDRKQKFKNRAERIARTELTFAYNAGRLDSYVRSGLVAGVKYQTIFDERRCPICASRQGIIVSLDDVDGLARLAIPTHPMCRCVWSPILKEEFPKQSKEKYRQLKNRDLVPGKTWLAGAIIASILLPDELIIGGALVAGLALLIKKFGSAKLARAAIATQINKIGTLGKQSVVRAPSVIPINKIVPLVIAPGIDLNTATPEQLRSLIPSLNPYQASKIVERRNNSQLTNLNDISNILNPNQLRDLKAIARENNLLNILHPENNLTPSSIWVNSGGIIPKSKTKAVFKLIKESNFSSMQELLKALRKQGIDVDRLNNYAKSRP